MNKYDPSQLFIFSISIFVFLLLVLIAAVRGYHDNELESKKSFHVYVLSDDDLLLLTDIKRLNDKIHKEFGKDDVL